MLHHLKQPWRAGITEQRYFFCDEADCPVVYFGVDGRCFEGDALRERVGQKEKGAEDMLCYCFDIRYGEGANDPALKAFVIDKTSAGLCNCEVRNPAGRCCLKDFPE